MSKRSILITTLFLTACGSTAPVKIGKNTYYSSKTNTAGIFGDVTAVAGKLMHQGNLLCVSQNKEFELVTKHMTDNIPGRKFGGAEITFKCIDNAIDPVMRKDIGVLDINVGNK